MEETWAEIADLKASMDATIEKLTSGKETLSEEVTRLNSIINNDSNNSSNPPSTDEKAKAGKANEVNGRKKCCRKQGAQKGHKKHELSEEDVKRMLVSDKCKHEIKKIGKVSEKYKVRYRIDMKVIPVNTEYLL